MSQAGLRPVIAEFAGTGLLLATVVGSGIMAQTLAGGNEALALLCNAIATGAGLYAYITVLGPVSGAHFNPAVSLVAWLQGKLAGPACAAYALAQVAGGLVGVLAAHAMFGLPLVQLSTHVRTGPALGLAEGVATFGLVTVILGGTRHAPERTPGLVAAYIVAAYWFTASTSFANPAVTLARAFTDTFAGIRLADVPAFAVAQVAGALFALLLGRFLFPRES